MADKNLISYCGRRPLGNITHEVIRPDDGSYSDSLKVTDCADGDIKAKAIYGGKEDCLDVNNHTQRVSVWADEWHSGGLYVCTLKGASEDLTIGGCIVVPGSETDIDIGNHSDQQSGRTIGVKLNFRRRDGKPVRVRVLHGHVPVILNPSQPYEINTIAKGWFSTVWDKLKRLAALFGITI
ncbi:MAG: hypothetical protein WC378_04465 [Opitutaceae bacterium]|jgi:hypothetical protein